MDKHDDSCASLTLLLSSPPHYPPCDCSLSRVATFEDPYGRKKPEPVPPHVVRMSEELKELAARLRNLDAFTDTKTFKELPTLDQKLLHDQRDEMESYAKTLSLRYFMALLDR